MSRIRVVEAGGPIRDVAAEFAENVPVQLDNDKNHSRTWAIRPRRPDSTVGKQQITVPELVEYDEKWSGDDVDDHGPKLTKHFLTACWTSPMAVVRT